MVTMAASECRAVFEFLFQRGALFRQFEFITSTRAIFRNARHKHLSPARVCSGLRGHYRTVFVKRKGGIRW